jgi:hypothetical protein
MKINGLVKAGTLALLSAVATGAFAQEINLQGSAAGGFNGTSATTLGGISYTGSTFNISTSGGFYALGGNPQTVNVNNLGSFSLTGAPQNYSGDSFTLDVTFTQPTGIINGNTNSYTAQLFGQVSSNTNGGAYISFGNTPKLFTFSNAQGSGSFDLNVNNVSLSPNNVAAVTGYGTGNVKAVPEPASMFCIATGLVGIVLKKKKK